MIHQEAYMLIALIKRDQVDALRATLATLNAPSVRDNPKLPFGKLLNVHFARFLILEAGIAADDTDCPASLVFSTCYDPPYDAHLSELLDVGEAGLREVFAFCRGFPANATRDDILAFMQAKRKKPETFYIGVRGRSLMQIRAEAALREHIESFLDAERRSPNADNPVQLRERIQQDVLAHKDKLGWAAERDSAGSSLQTFWDYRGLLVIILFGLVMLVLALACALFKIGWEIVWMLLLTLLGLAIRKFLQRLRWHEEQDRDNDPLLGYAPGDDREAIEKRIRGLAEQEDFGVNNQFSSLNRVKPGRFRKFTQSLVLIAINFAARYFANKGSLSDIPTIHFARWVLVDGGKRLLFESNFDGSWESYLGDFVDKARKGLTAVWSNCVGFPPSKFLVFEGAEDEQPFKEMARTSQIETQVWYSAYDHLTTKNIQNNREIHRGLFGPMNEDQARAWLKKL